jgi:HK97 gp10 family phage protein
MTPKQFAKWLESLQPEVADKMSRIMVEGGNKIQKEAIRTLTTGKNAKGNKMAGQGGLQNSIESTANITGKVSTEVIVGSTLPYAPFVEYGTGPHKSSSGSAKFKEDLKRWCELNGLGKYYYAIYKNIIKNGTSERPFLIPAFNKIAPKVQRALEKVLKEIK